MGLQISFWIFSVIAVGGGLIALFERSVVRSAFALFGTFLGVAGLFLTLGADFLAWTQVLIYAGGIMVLYLFGLMLTKPSPFERNLRRIGLALGLTASFALLFFWRLFAGAEWGALPAAELPAPEPAARGIGLAFLRPEGWLYAFEFASIILLLALIGSVYIARRRSGPPPAEEAS